MHGPDSHKDFLLVIIEYQSSC